MKVAAVHENQKFLFIENERKQKLNKLKLTEVFFQIEYILIYLHSNNSIQSILMYCLVFAIIFSFMSNQISIKRLMK